MDLSKERIEQYANAPRMCNVNDEIREMARRLLAAEDQQPFGYYSAEVPTILEQQGYANIARECAGEYRLPLYIQPQRNNVNSASWPEKIKWSYHDDMTQGEVEAWNNAIDACLKSMCHLHPQQGKEMPDASSLYEHLSYQAKLKTSIENIEDVLDACRAAMLSNEPVRQSYKLVGEVVAWNSPQRQGVYRSVDFRWLDLNVPPGTRLYARHADFVSEVDQDLPAK